MSRTVNSREATHARADGRIVPTQVWTEADLQVLDALDFVRRRPERFFVDGVVSAVRILQWMARDVLLIGGGAVVIRRHGRWWTIGSDVDWLQDAGCGEVELFSRLKSDPRLGVNSMRGEILAMAFAGAVWTAAGERRVCVRGETPPAAVWIDAGARRVIAFKLDEA